MHPLLLSTLFWIYGHCAPHVPPAYLLGITLQESGGYENAIDDDTARRSYYPKTAQEGRRLAVLLEEEGHDIDVGLLGINFNGMTRDGVPIAAAFDPCINASLSQRIFLGDMEAAQAAGYRGPGALVAALGRYNTGTLNGNPSYSASVIGLISRVSIQLAAKHPPQQLAAMDAPTSSRGPNPYQEAVERARKLAQAKNKKMYEAILKQLGPPKKGKQ